VQPELELSHDPEVAAATAQAPEQVGVVGFGRPHDVPAGGDRFEGRHVVARQPVLAREPAHAAAEGEPADAGVRHVAPCRRQPVLLRGQVEGAEQGPDLDPRAPGLGIDPDPAATSAVPAQRAISCGRRSTMAFQT
jgi:hypothetical protein